MNEPSTLADGRYLLVEKLGEGGMAVVYLGFDQRLQVWRAIKLLNESYISTPHVLRRFEAEAQTMAILEHRNLVRVYDVGRDGRLPFIVMELVDGGSLVEWLEKHGPMPSPLAISVVLEVIEGIGAAHDKGVVHRDIKPQNILVTQSGTCRVTDFGIARVGDSDASLTKTGTVMGTWGYMAPEQRSDGKNIDARADVYGITATLYTLLTNRMPVDLFAADRDQSILKGVPDSLTPILIQGTEYDRDDRYSTVRHLADVLRDVQSQLGPVLPETPPLVCRSTTSVPTPSPTDFIDAKAIVQAKGKMDVALDTMPPDLGDGILGELASMGSGGSNSWLKRMVVLSLALSSVVFLLGLALGIQLFLNGGVPSMETKGSPSTDMLPPTPTPPPKVVADTGLPVAPIRVLPQEEKTTPAKPVEASKASPRVPPPPAVDPPDCLKIQTVGTYKIGDKALFSGQYCGPVDARVVLYYRSVGSEQWKDVLMPFRLGKYVAQLVITEEYSEGLEYYGRARNSQVGSPKKPRRIQITSSE